MIRSLILTAIAFSSPLAAVDWTVDGDHSNAVFKVQHMGAGNTWGRFDQIAGDIAYDDTNVAANKVTVTIKAASISTKVPKMEEHLRSPDFFDVVQFPTLSFKSLGWAKTADGQFDVTGELTIHGVTKPITIKVVRTGLGKHAYTQKDLVGLESSFTIKRSDYGMKGMIGPVGDEVAITVSLEGVKK